MGSSSENGEASLGSEAAREGPNKSLSHDLAKRFRERLMSLTPAERKQKNLRQEDLAQALRLRQSGLNNLLSGRTQFDVFQFHKLAKLLEIDIADLLPPELKPFPNPILAQRSLRPEISEIDKRYLGECYDFVESYYRRRNDPKEPEYLASKAAGMLQVLKQEGIDMSAVPEGDQRERILKDALLDALA